MFSGYETSTALAIAGILTTIRLVQVSNDEPPGSLLVKHGEYEESCNLFKYRDQRPLWIGNLFYVIYSKDKWTIRSKFPDVRKSISLESCSKYPFDSRSGASLFWTGNWKCRPVF